MIEIINFVPLKIILLFMKFIIFTIFFALLLTSCGIIKKIAGADIDPVQFDKAREAKMMEVKFLAATSLAKRLNEGNPPENADISFYLSEAFLNKIAMQYDSSEGWLDPATSYKILKTKLTLFNGSAIATLTLLAHNNSYNVDVSLSMDCIVTFKMLKNELEMNLEPFNISPIADAKGLLGGTDEIIENLIKINLANLSKSFPPLKIPLSFTNDFLLEKANINIKDKVNMVVSYNDYPIKYSLKLNEILIFKGKVFVAMSIDKVEVK